MNAWDNYEWESWIPVEIREQITDFWSSDTNRGPQEWLENVIHREAPRTGDIVTLPELLSKNRVTGLYVHAWNNIGRIVHVDGSFSYVSFTSHWSLQQ